MIPPARGIAASFSSSARKVWMLYYDGFRSMTIGKTLWIIFVVIKFIFFPNLLKENFDTDAERADHVRQELLRK